MLRIHLLGPMRALFDGQPIKPPKRRDAELLWAYLLLNRGQRLDRGALAEALWPDTPRARATLRQALHALQQRLPTAPETLPWLLRDDDRLGWNSDAPAWIDVVDFERGIQAAGEEPGPPSVEALRSALALYEGELLEGLDEAWLLPERQRLDTLYIQGLELLVAQARSAGDGPLGLSTAQRLLAHDPLREESHRLLMREHARIGDRVAAMAQYAQCQEILASAFGAAPEPETLALAERIRLGQDLDEGTELTPDASPRRAPPPLPDCLGRLVGPARRHQLADRLRGAGLLTVVGPPGCGKSRLAAEAALVVRSDFAGGLWWLDLDGCAAEGDLPSQVAVSLGIAATAATALDALTAAWEGEPTLLVLDHAERRTDDCATFAAMLLARMPRLRIGVASRERLGLGQEALWRVPLLDLPPADRRWDMLHPPEAVDLFVSRARGVRAESGILTAARALVVAAIARATDGIPEVLVRAAAALDGHGLEPLAAAFQQGDFAALDRAGPVEGLRHATWSASIAASEERLSRAERRLFRRLSVVEGPFDAAAAEWLAGDGEGITVGGSSDEPLDLLEQLVNQSLVTADVRSPLHSRFRMPAPIRWFARERLIEEGAWETIAQRWAEPRLKPKTGKL